MTTSAPATAKKNVDTEVQYAESVIAWNVKMLLTAQNKSQSALAAFLGIQRPTMTNKMKGRIAWSVADLVKSADFLGTTAEALMDDSLMSQLKTGYTESTKPKYGVFAEKPGALVGAGVGGIAGWIKGNKVKEEYQDNVEEMEKQAERAKRVYEVTGLSIDKVHFANDDLNEAMKDTNLTAEELANYINEDMAKVAQEAFGDITLSLTEIKDLAQEITFGKSIESVAEFSKATDTVSSDLASLKTTISDLKKQNWKASLGMELDETEKDDYKKAIDNFAKSASQYIEDNHYQATVALKLINGSGADTTGLDNMYSGMKTQIDDLTAQLSDKVTIALQDGVIQLDEQDEILNLQQQIQDITSKLSSAQEEASLDVLKIKYGSGSGLTYDSFTQMQEELKAQVQS